MSNQRDVHIVINSVPGQESSGELEEKAQMQADVSEGEQVANMLSPFHAEAEAISQAIECIEKTVHSIDELHGEIEEEHVTAVEKAEASARISDFVTQTSKTAQAIRKRLKRISDENEQFAREYPSNTSALRIRVSTHQAITRNFMQAMQHVEDVQERHRDAVRGAVERQLRAFNPTATDDDIAVALRNAEEQAAQGDRAEKDETTTNNSSMLLCELPPDEQKRLKAQLDFLSSRNKDMRQLEDNIVELHQMFVDMRLLVDRQGDLLNNIEYNVQETKGRAEAGMNELIEAHDFQRQATRKKWLIALIVLALVAVITIPILIKYVPLWFPSKKPGDSPGTTGLPGTGGLPGIGGPNSGSTPSANPSVIRT